MTHGLGEGREDGYFVFFGEGIEKGVVLEVDLLETLLETDPSAILLRLCGCVASGKHYSIAKRVEMITGGSVDIFKLGSICCGIIENRRKVSL